MSQKLNEEAQRSKKEKIVERHLQSKQFHFDTLMTVCVYTMAFHIVKCGKKRAIFHFKLHCFSLTDDSMQKAQLIHYEMFARLQTKCQKVRSNTLRAAVVMNRSAAIK